jgi:hypothetical protein
MPATSIRDLVIHGDDVVVGTHGRSFWILDDITPLRQINAQVATSTLFLFQPQLATRVQRNVNTDTPLPPEEPAGKNPPDGAIINYYLQSDISGPVTLEILDQSNKLVRRFASTDQPEPVNDKDYDVPTYWFRPPQILNAKSGMQRFVWDLRYPPPQVAQRVYPISANYRDTPPYPVGPFVPPGRYTLRLNANGRTLTQPLAVRIDPRVKTPPAALDQQFKLSMQAYRGMQQSREALDQIRKLRAQVKDLRGRAAQGALSDALLSLDQKLATLETETETRAPAGGAANAGEMNLNRVNGAMASLLDLLQSADAAPTTQAVAASAEFQRILSGLLARWNEIKSKDVRALNDQLRQAGLPLLSTAS